MSGTQFIIILINLLKKLLHITKHDMMIEPYVGKWSTFVGPHLQQPLSENLNLEIIKIVQTVN